MRKQGGKEYSTLAREKEPMGGRAITFFNSMKSISQRSFAPFRTDGAAEDADADEVTATAATGESGDTLRRAATDDGDSEDDDDDDDLSSGVVGTVLSSCSSC